MDLKSFLDGLGFHSPLSPAIRPLSGYHWDLLFALIQAMSIFLVVAYLYCKSPAFKPFTTHVLGRRDRLYLYVFFSLISIMGTYLGLPVKDAIANTRAIGPVLAGLIGGPLLGTAVGFTGGLHRYFFGGFTALSCGISTTMEGLIAGMVHLALVRRHQSQSIYDPRLVFAVAVVAEITQMGIILLVSKPYADALALVRVIAVPMILSSSTGAALFMSIIRDQKNTYDRIGVLVSARAFHIAERTMQVLRHGFTSETAQQLAAIIYQETNVGAVAITDTEKVLAFVGSGADHHLPGTPIASELTHRAIQHREVVFADGLQDHFRCPLSPGCVLDSVLVVPLHMDNTVIGTIKLYEPRNKRFLNINKTLGEGITNLLSSQLLACRYEEQKNLLLTAELKLLQAQVNPHFLFNSLNTIIAIIRKDAERAKDLLIHLSHFLRKNLKRSSEFSTLEEELDHITSYLIIEKARFENRLQVEMNIDPALLHLKVPTFTLQPLVENAIKHGISTLLTPGLARIHAYRRDGVACIEIEDNAGTYHEDAHNDGLGIQIVDRRIKNLLGNQYGTSIACEPHQRTRITVELPLEVAP
ncbi:MAG TPA: sensor histidine kinase [Syntrophobacteraceae bacterium]|nr:sensor histidine kinase [Syntrophobacteraceae bacterium]